MIIASTRTAVDNIAVMFSVEYPVHHKIYLVSECRFLITIYRYEKATFRLS
jgi:hypothetical protein